MHYREALPRDLEGIISIHVRGGQQAYTSILPARYLEGGCPGRRTIYGALD